jgi:membrane fusion protein, copper/silver efflux system
MKKLAAFGVLVVIAIAAFVAGRYSGGTGGEHAGRRVLYYVDPMHPWYRSSKPGIAPDCGMPLEPVYEGSERTAKVQLPPGAVSITPERQQLVGVRVQAVEKNSGSRVIRTTGKVEAEDNRVYKLTAGTEGWITALQNNPPGTIVKKDELLASFYSREFRNAEQAYLGSLASVERLRGGRDMREDDPTKSNDVNLRINEEQLRALGMGEPQIRALAKNKEITRDIAVVSPVDGVVLSRNIAPDERFDTHTEFYRIADLNSVWVVADIYGDEVKVLRPGARVKVTVRELAKTISATVSDTPPTFDAASRTLKLRMEAANPGWVLRPDMFVDIEFEAKAPAGLSVPEEAVLDNGMQKIVYVETSDGVFEPRGVEVGPAYADRVIVIRGLAQGERVVTSGNFLIDSESRMRSAAVVSPGARSEVVAVRDPVCGMPLSAEQMQSKAHVGEYRGEKFVFCSEQCQKKFEMDPAKYAGEKLRSAANPERASRRGDD